jgi:hypothetical protein
MLTFIRLDQITAGDAARDPADLAAVRNLARAVLRTALADAAAGDEEARVWLTGADEDDGALRHWCDTADVPLHVLRRLAACPPELAYRVRLAERQAGGGPEFAERTPTNGW